MSIHLNEQERRLLEVASAQAHTNLSDFVRRKALEAAEADVLERGIVTIPAGDWKTFEKWATQPAREIAGLKEFSARKPTWRE